MSILPNEEGATVTWRNSQTNVHVLTTLGRGENVNHSRQLHPLLEFLRDRRSLSAKRGEESGKGTFRLHATAGSKFPSPTEAPLLNRSAGSGEKTSIPLLDSSRTRFPCISALRGAKKAAGGQNRPTGNSPGETGLAPRSHFIRNAWVWARILPEEVADPIRNSCREAHRVGT